MTHDTTTDRTIHEPAAPEGARSPMQTRERTTGVDDPIDPTHVDTLRCGDAAPTLPARGDGRPRRGARATAPSLFVAALLVVGAALVLIAIPRAPGVATPSTTSEAAGSLETVSAGVAASLDTAEPETTASDVSLVDVSELVDDLVDSVVRIEVTARSSGRFRTAVVTGSGSGVILSADGTIVTNAHVVDGAESITVALADGIEYAATLVGSDSDTDIAVLAIGATGLDPVAIGTTDTVAVGDPVVAIGYPLGLEGAPTVSTGIVSAVDRHLEDADTSLSGVLQTDAAITEGSSGGALVDAGGSLIGVTTAVGVSSVGIEGIGFSIPIETVMGAVEALLGT